MRLFSRKKNKQSPSDLITDCQHCDHFSVGHLDRMANWMRCDKGHRLIPESELTIEHHLYYDPDEETVMLTKGGWAVGPGDGEPMYSRTDCKDWKRKKFRLDLGNPEYD